VKYLPGIFALLVGISGWFYLFYSKAAKNLSGIEDPRLNQQRTYLRRTNAVLMLALAVCFVVLMYRSIPQERAVEAAAMLAMIVALLLAILVLALIDVRLTAKLRARLRERRKP
jgi:hypothetical protein